MTSLPASPRAPSTGRRFANYIVTLSAAGALLLAAMIIVPATFAAVPIMFIAVLYLSVNLARSIGWLALIGPLLTAIVWFAAAAALIGAAFDGPNEQESEGWSVVFTILGIGFTVIVAEAGVTAGLIWRTTARRRAEAAHQEGAANPPS